MAQQTSSLEANLAAAAGDDPVLLAELLQAFVDSMKNHIDLLGRARCDGNWAVTAMRLKGLGNSFHVQPLVDLAEEALQSAPGDPRILRRLQEYSETFRGN